MLDGFCQNGNCKRPASVQLNGTDRVLHLCPEDADYYLHLRDEKQAPAQVAAFEKKCHKE